MKVLYFASLRDRLKCAEEELPDTTRIESVNELLKLLRERGEPWLSVLQTTRLKVAVNQEMAHWDSPLQASDEVAFFPPVTGG